MKRTLLLALVCLLGLAAATAGCVTQPFVWVDKYQSQPRTPQPYRIAPGDQLFVSIWKQQQLTGDVTVREDGNITLPLVGDVAVVGLTPTDAAETIRRRLDGLVLDPRVSVAVRDGKSEYVSVTGEVRTPGQYPLQQGDTVLHLIARAGGLTEFARSDGIYVVRAHPEPVRVRFHYARLSGGDPASLSFVLKPGDVIVVQ